MVCLQFNYSIVSKCSSIVIVPFKLSRSSFSFSFSSADEEHEEAGDGEDISIILLKVPEWHITAPAEWTEATVSWHWEKFFRPSLGPIFHFITSNIIISIGIIIIIITQTHSEYWDGAMHGCSLVAHLALRSCLALYSVYHWRSLWKSNLNT